MMAHLIVFVSDLAQIDFVEVPLLSQSTDTDVAVLSIQEQRLINVAGRAFQFLPAQVYIT